MSDYLPVSQETREQIRAAGRNVIAAPGSFRAEAAWFVACHPGTIMRLLDDLDSLESQTEAGQ